MKTSFIVSTIIFIFLITVSFFMCVSTMVSIKYETEGGNCLSKVDGRDLCQILKFSKIVLVASIGLLVGSLLMNNRQKN